MNIKDVVKKFELTQNDLNIKLTELKHYFTDEKRLWAEYEKLDEAFFLNDKVMSFLADSLQQVDQQEHLDLCDLQDIKKIYRLLVDYYPDNIQYREDLIEFVYNVLDDENEALLLIEETERRIDNLRTNLGRIKSDILNNE